MGLNQDDPDHRIEHRFAGVLTAWMLPGTIVAVAAVLALTGDAGRELLRYDRLAIAGGEVWRLLSGHIVHLSWTHYALNAAGMFLIWYLVGARFSAASWGTVAVLTIAGIDAGFWLLEPQLEWYVGLSGVLHGLLAAGVVGGIRAGHKDAWLLGIVLVLKLGYEQVVGPIPGSAAATGGAVIVAAHLYGAVTAAVAGAIMPVRVQRPASI